MPFNLSFPSQNPAVANSQLNAGELIFILGANGTGKSSLLHRFANQNSSHVRKISAHRQTWMNSDALDLTPARKLQTEEQIKNQDRTQESRYKDSFAAQRASMTIYELINAENVRARAIAAAVDADDPDGVSDAKKVEAPITVINELLRQSNIPVKISVRANERLMASKNGGPEYSAAELSDGERNALMIAGNVLTAPPGVLLIVDEPERHLHRREVESAVAGSRAGEDFHWLRAFGIADGDGYDSDQIEAKRRQGVYALPFYSVEAIYFHPEIIRKVAARQANVDGGDAAAVAEKAIAEGVKGVAAHTERLSKSVSKKAARKLVLEQIPNDNDLLEGKEVIVTNSGPIIHAARKAELDAAVAANDLVTILTRCSVRECAARENIIVALGFRDIAKYEKAVRHLLTVDDDALAFVRGLFGQLATELEI